MRPCCDSTGIRHNRGVWGSCNGLPSPEASPRGERVPSCNAIWATPCTSCYTLHVLLHVSHAPCPRVRARRAVGGRSGGSAEPGQVQQGQPVSALRHRRVFEIRVGGTPQVQDGGGRDPSLRKGAETRPGSNPPQASNGRRQIILQQDLPRPDDAPRHSPLFHSRGHESQRGGTFQSHLEATPLSVFHRREHAVVCVCPARDRAGVESIPSPKHRDGPSRRRRRQRRSRVAETVRRPRETEATHLQSGRPRAIEQDASHVCK